MTLNEFIKKYNVTEVEIARRARCSQSTVNKVRRGVGNWTIDLLARISAATEGMVAVEDFLTEKAGRASK